LAANLAFAQKIMARPTQGRGGLQTPSLLTSMCGRAIDLLELHGIIAWQRMTGAQWTVKCQSPWWLHSSQ